MLVLWCVHGEGRETPGLWAGEWWDRGETGPHAGLWAGLQLWAGRAAGRARCPHMVRVHACTHARSQLHEDLPAACRDAVNLCVQDVALDVAHVHEPLAGVRKLVNRGQHAGGVACGAYIDCRGG
eukprot:364568-Chlamydomonas_euryale.AAC.7